MLLNLDEDVLRFLSCGVNSDDSFASGAAVRAPKNEASKPNGAHRASRPVSFIRVYLEKLKLNKIKWNN